uniref:mRNA (guanine-N(7))-methyltransferase n=1 Tax=Hyaloperonospora arabidopsidis (strain Emoy2) TaxID=559515 RepID=M4BZS8_HYAAE
MEVLTEALPPEWEVAMSRSKNMPYYYNAQTQKVYWVDDELPRGWSHQFDRDGRMFYFHVRDKNGTISYDKPVLRTVSHDLPVPLLSANEDDVTSPEPVPVPAPSYDKNESLHGYVHPESGDPPVLERKKSNSLMDLLSPGPPALGDEEEPLRAPTSRAMQISNLVTGPERPLQRGKRSYSAISKEQDEEFQGSAREKDQDAAAAFYNQLQRCAQSDRADSLLFHMRALNNWVKSVLINEYSRRDGDRVLDLACGKGGDLMKWTKRNLAMYVGVDIAQKSLEDAVERYTSFSRGGRGGNDWHKKSIEAHFVQGDLGVVDLLRDEMHCWNEQEGWHDAVPLPSSAVGSFSIVSVQFSFHYMFGDAERADRFFSTVHELLADGGVLIATTVDPNKLLMKYYQGLRPPEDEMGDQTCNKPDVSIVDEKNREVCSIQFDANTRAQLSGPNAAPEGAFGLRYNFTLRDRVEDDADGGNSGQAVDLPEYLVPDDLVAKLLREHGFELLLKQNFHRFIHLHKDQDHNRTLLEKMHVTNIRGSISDAEWEIAGLYQVLAFKKTY